MSLLTPEITEYFKNHRGRIKSIEIYRGYLITHQMNNGFYKYRVWKILSQPTGGISKPVEYLYGRNYLVNIKKRINDGFTRNSD